MLLFSFQLHHILDALVRRDSSTMLHRKDLVVEARGSSRKRRGLIGRGSGEDVQLQPPRNDQRRNPGLLSATCYIPHCDGGDDLTTLYNESALKVSKGNLPLK